MSDIDTLPELVATTVHRPVTESTILRADTYPAKVTFSFATHSYPRARAIVTMDRIVILVEGGTQIMELYSAPLLDVEGNHRSITATTEDGTITFSKAPGCGCGSSLKSYRAYRDSQRMAFR
jgi:hypothetical protein